MIDRGKIPPQVSALDMVKGIQDALFCTITDTDSTGWRRLGGWRAQNNTCQTKKMGDTKK
jgi:hypothetical protein